MASFSNKMGCFVGAFNAIPAVQRQTLFTLSAIDAAGESVTLIGNVRLEAGSGSKTISAAGGGKLHISWFNLTTFANGGTNLRVGIQDVDAATGLEDGTFDVYCDFTGGTDTMTDAVVMTFPMESGSKTVNHNDLIAISVELTTRAGADTLTLLGVQSETGNFPYCTADTGSGPVRNTTCVITACVEFDDGTVGWINSLICGFPTSSSYASNSTPDEYCLLFTMPFSGTMDEVVAKVGSIATTDTFDVVVYSDPTGTPQVVSTKSYNPFLSSSTSNINILHIPITPFNFSANTTYAISIKPTTTNSISLATLDFNTGNSKLRRASMLGENWSLGTRTDNTGAFTSNTERLPAIGFFVRDIYLPISHTH